MSAAKAFVVLVLVGAVYAQEKAAIQKVCYDDLGCFDTGPPFSAFGRIALLPDSPERINTKFMLFTRESPSKGHRIYANDIASLESSTFRGDRPTKFIVHGWIDGMDIGKWLADTAKRFINTEDCNAFAVDWRGGGRTLYGQATANTRVVGAQIAQISEFLKEQTGATFNSMHILGHSLGAHTAGYAGERMPDLGRITGMDPADPYFQNMSTQVRLDESDANFVDVVHTDANDIFVIANIFTDEMGLGLWQPSGHVDVYPNGGKKQPGCSDRGPIHSMIEEGLADGIRYTICCGHMRACDYTFETIGSKCPWRSYRCDGGYKEFKTGRCLRCPTSGDKTKGCNGVGTLASKPSDGSVNNMYYMETGPKAPFCRYHYHIQLVIDGKKNKEQKGIVWVKLHGDSGTTDFLQLGEDNFYIKAGSVHDYLVTTPLAIRKVNSVELKWKHDAKLYEVGQWQIGKPSIYPSSVTVFSGEYQTEGKFCDHSGELFTKKTHHLNSC